MEYDTGDVVVLPSHPFSCNAHTLYAVGMASEIDERGDQNVWVFPLIESAVNYKGKAVSNKDLIPVEEFNLILSFEPYRFQIEMLRRCWSSARNGARMRYWRKSQRDNHRVTEKTYKLIESQYGPNPKFVSREYLRNESIRKNSHRHITRVEGTKYPRDEGVEQI